MLKKVVLVAVAMLLPTTAAMAFHPNEDCDRCHVPHEARVDEGMPLWNPETATEETVFTTYDSYYMDADPGDPTSSTLLCLSCHDGTGRHAMMPTSATGDLSGSHPQEFAYDGALVALDDELKDPDTAGLGPDGGSIAEDMLEPTTYQMKCTTCHDVHIQGLHDGASVEEDALPLVYPGDYGTTVGEDPNASADEQAKAALRGTGISSRTWRTPHLRDVAGIGWEIGHGGAAADPDDWGLSYGTLCRTCHIK